MTEKSENSYEEHSMARGLSGDGDAFWFGLLAGSGGHEAPCGCNAQVGGAWVYFSGDAGGELLAGVWGEDGIAFGHGAARAGAGAGDERGGGVYDEAGV